MATKIHLKHTKSSATTANTEGVTIPRLPSSGDLLHGEIAINYRSGYETLAIKNSEGQIVPFVTNGQTIDATKPEGLVNGQIGMDVNGEESFYIYNGVYSKWQPVSTNYVDDESDLAGIPVVKDPQIAYVKSTGLVYTSQYDDTTSAQTWLAMATLNPDSMRLADSQEPKVIIDYFTTDVVQLTANILVFDVDAKKLKQYGKMVYTGETAGPELLYTYDPSKNLIYYNRGTQSAYRWTGTQMAKILGGPTISTDNTMSAVTGNNTVTISSTVISAITPANTIVNKMTPAGSANSNDHSSYSFIFGADNAVNWASGATTFGANNTIASGANNSFVEGCRNTVSGGASHAEGSATTAAGTLSHSEGNGTYAGGLYSHAEGCQTSALGESSHTEGVKTAASGLASHAEGSATTASGTRSHAEGYNNIASGENSHVGGRLSLAAGRDSFAHGYANSAYCAMSVAMGSGNIVGESGDANSAVAASSVALGRSNSAMGYASFACGHYNYTNGMYTNAIGESTSALNVASHSEGFLSTASAMASHAEGAILPTRLGLYESDDENYDAIVEHPASDFTAYIGNFLLVNDSLYSISAATLSPTQPDTIGYLKVELNNENLQAVVSGHTDSNPVYGQYFNPNETGTIANGIGSHSEGFSTYSEGQASHSEGSSTSGVGDFSHAEGSGTCASGMSSHAEGHRTQANGVNSHAEGESTHANGRNSHAGGNATSAIGNASYALGSGTVTNNTAEFACGKYNVSTSGTDSTMFSVGVGKNNDRKNALEVRADGKIYIYDNDGNQVCLQDILQTLQGYHS